MFSYALAFSGKSTTQWSTCALPTSYIHIAKFYSSWAFPILVKTRNI